MVQTNLNNEWTIVNKEINKNKLNRFNWKLIFGKSLSKIVAYNKIKGLTTEETYSKILRDYPFLIYEEELKKRLWIGINARFAETNSMLNEVKNINKEVI